MTHTVEREMFAPPVPNGTVEQAQSGAKEVTMSDLAVMLQSINGKIETIEKRVSKVEAEVVFTPEILKAKVGRRNLFDELKKGVATKPQLFEYGFFAVLLFMSIIAGSINLFGLGKLTMTSVMIGSIMVGLYRAYWMFVASNEAASKHFSSDNRRDFALNIGLLLVFSILIVLVSLFS